MADDSDAEVLEVVDRQPRQHRAVDLIVLERRLILPEAEARQTPTSIDVSSEGRRSMMVLQCHNVYGFGSALWFGSSRHRPHAAGNGLRAA
jgi:hypothetical protein